MASFADRHYGGERQTPNVLARAEQVAHNESQRNLSRRNLQQRFPVRLQETTGAKLRPGEELDVGTPSAKFLISKRAEAAINNRHPRKILGRDEEGKATAYGRHPVCSHSGCHICLCQRWCNSVLGDHGLAVVLWFQFLTFIAWMFCLMTVFAIPSIVIYSSGGAYEEEIVTFTGRYALATPANLGQSRILCGTSSLADTDTPGSITLACPANGGFRIGYVSVMQGHVLGECGCPADQVPVGGCRGEVDASGEACVAGSSREQDFCHFSWTSLLNVEPISGLRMNGGACCASRLSDGVADFSQLDIRWDRPATANLTDEERAVQAALPGTCEAQMNPTLAARAACVGLRNCTIPATPWGLSTFSYPPPPDGGSDYVPSDCPGGVLSPWGSEKWTCQMPSFAARSGSAAVPEQAACGGAEWRRVAVSLPPGVSQNETVFDPDTSVRWENDSSTTFEVDVLMPSGDVQDRFRTVAVAVCYADRVHVSESADASRIDESAAVNIEETLTKQDAAILLSLVDAAGVLVLFLLVQWMRNRELLAEQRNDRFTAAAYSVMMTTLPKHRSLAQLYGVIKRHFDQVLSMEPAVRERGDVEVADINFGEVGKGRQIAMLMRRGDTLRRLERATNHAVVQFLRVNASKRRVAARRREVQRSVEALTQIDDRIDAQSSKRTTKERAVVAYISFKRREGKLRALARYPTFFCDWLCQHRDLRMFGHRIAVSPAPDPADIVWENLEIGACQRSCRQGLTCLVTLALLVLGATILFTVETQRREAALQFPDVDCQQLQDPDNKTLVSLNHFSDQLGLESDDDGRLGCYCSDYFTLSDPTAVLDIEFPAPVEEPAGSGQWKLLPLSNPLAESAQLCTDWAESFLVEQSLTYSGSIVTLTINFVMRYLLDFLVAFEGRHSRTEELMSRAYKLFALTFLNTAAITLLINAHFNSPELAFLSRGQYRDFSDSWFSTVGVSLTSTMMLNVVVSQATVAVGLFWVLLGQAQDRSCRCCDPKRTKKATQHDYNQVQFGPYMLLDERYAATYNVIFVSLLLSAGIPLLLPVAWLTVVVTFWVDKFMFSFWYRDLTAQSGQLAIGFSSLLPYAVVLHFLFAAWIFSNPELFPPENVVPQANYPPSATESLRGSESLTATWHATASQLVNSAANVSLSAVGTEAPLGLLDPVQVQPSARNPVPLAVGLVLAALLVVLLLLRRCILPQLRGICSIFCPCCCRYCAPKPLVSEAGTWKEKVKDAKGRKVTVTREPPDYFDALRTEDLERMVGDGRQPGTCKPQIRVGVANALGRRVAATRHRKRHIHMYHDILRQMAEQQQVVAQAKRQLEQVNSQMSAARFKAGLQLQLLDEQLQQSWQMMAKLRGMVKESDQLPDQEAAPAAPAQGGGVAAAAGAAGVGNATGIATAGNDNGDNDAQLRALQLQMQQVQSQRQQVQAQVPSQQAAVAQQRFQEATAALTNLRGMAARLAALTSQPQGESQQQVSGPPQTISGLPSYDLNENHEYQQKFGLNSDIDSRYKRRLRFSAALMVRTPASRYVSEGGAVQQRPGGGQQLQHPPQFTFG